MLKIVSAPNKILTKLSKPVTGFDKKLALLIREMRQTLIAQKDPQGVGLAAPQVGVDLSLFIMRPSEKAKTRAFMNPRILQIVPLKALSDNKGKNTTKGKKPSTKLEGCLSVPKIWSPLTRPTKVLLEYQDMTGTLRQEWFSGFEAVIVQHEVDHLNGVLFTQRALEQNCGLFEEKDGELVKKSI